MSAALQEWTATLWSVPAWRFLLVVILLEMTVAVAQIGWLSLRTAAAGWHSRKEERFEAVMGPAFFEALDTPEARVRWVAQARRARPRVVRSFLERWLLHSDGAFQRQIADLYRDIGLHRRDRRDLRSRDVLRRQGALRRLLRVAVPEDRPFLIRHAPPDHASRLLVLHALARSATAEELLPLFQDMEVPRRLMEQPVFAALRAVPPPTMEALMARWAELRSPRVRRIFLVHAAMTVPACAIPWLEQAARAEDRELRAGAAAAAALLWDPGSWHVLLDLLGDPDPAVRARTARALGQRGDPRGMDPLTFTLGDPAYWVRQNSAASLRTFGPRGLRRLAEAAAAAADPYAAQAARQELARHEVLTRAVGGTA